MTRTLDSYNFTGKQEFSGEGVYTVLLVDISASMVHNNAWFEATTFVQDYVAGLVHFTLKTLHKNVIWIEIATYNDIYNHTSTYNGPFLLTIHFILISNYSQISVLPFTL